MSTILDAALEETREKFRSWIDTNAPVGLAELTDWRVPISFNNVPLAMREAMATDLYVEWENRLLEAHLICPQWPDRFGGSGLSSLEIAIFNEELDRARVPRIVRGFGEKLVAPVILVHGTEAQQAYFLPRILSKEDVYCQGFSEPDHGSDLGGSETRGVIDGEDIVITGSKIWTSGAEEANMLFVLCKTSSELPKHHNLSYVLLSMIDNGVEVVPIRQMSGQSEFCQEFIDSARAPLFNIIGPLNDGWRVAMSTLGNERGSSARVTTLHLDYEREFWALVDSTRDSGRESDPLVRQQLAWAFTNVQLLRFFGWKSMKSMISQTAPGSEASIFKVLMNEYHQKLGELAMNLGGAKSLIRPAGAGYPVTRWQDTFLWSRADTIAGGTSEIQRNVIGERLLGLPKGAIPQGRSNRQD